MLTFKQIQQRLPSLNMRLKTILPFFIFFLFNTCFLNAQDQPIPDWVKDIGGNGESKLAGIAVDKNDNVYVAGNFQGILTVDHSGVSTPILLTSKGHYDIYIAKYTPDGKLLWAKSIGGSNLDQANNLAVDKDGNVILGASFSSSSIDCDPGTGVFTVNSNGGEDALVLKLDTDGNFIWARNVGSPNTDRGHVVSTDKDGNVIFVGSFTASLTVANTNLINRGGFDGFVVKYSPSGNVIWAAGFGSSSDDEIKSVKTDSEGSIAIMGYFGSAINLNPRGTAQNFTASGETYFLAKYNDNGLLEWANKIDGTSSKTVASISVGPTNDIFVTGVFSGAINLNSSNTITLSAVNNRNLFIAKYNKSGQTQWAKTVQSTGTNPYSYYITVDNENNAYIGGFFDQTLTFNAGVAPKILTFNGGRDTFFAKYDTNGNYKWAFNFGSGCTGNFGHKIDVDSKKNVLLGGAFCQTVDFNPSNCNLSLTAKHGTSDGYIAKFNQVKMAGESPVITKFELAQQKSPAIIDVVNKKISISVLPGTDITRLSPIIETDLGVLSPLSNTEANFATPKIYKITANCVEYLWEVTVSSAAVNNINICSGTSISISGENQVSATYQWEIYSNGTWVNAPLNSTQIDYQTSTILNSNSTPNTIQYRRKNLSTNPNTYDSYTNVVVSPAIQNNLITATQTTFCNNASFTIIGSTPVAEAQSIFTYTWQRSPDNITWNDVPNMTQKDIGLSNLNETTYFRRIVKVGACNVTSAPLKIDVLAPPLVSIAGNITGCSIVTLTAAGGVSYQWNGGLTPNQATNTFTTSGTYIVTVTNAEGCSATMSKTVMIGAGQTNITGNNVGCNSVMLTATGGVNYNWDGGLTPNQAKNTFTTSGTYNVTITDVNGCITTLSKTVTVNTNSLPTLQITASKLSICEGDEITFKPSYSNAGDSPSFKWFKNGIQSTTSEIYTAKGLKDGDEIHCDIISSNSCSLPFSSNKIKITVNPIPQVTIDEIVFIENDGAKTLNPQVNSDVISYKWFPSTGLDNPNVKNPKANPESTTIYKLTVVGAGNCVAEATIKVVVLKEIFIPNVFSPNGDGKNDQWLIRNISDYIGTKVQIFNRYGQQVFKNDNFISPWDGAMNGKPLPLGSYYYILDLANKAKTRYTGSVTILR